jgi:NTE family protein
MTPPPFTLVLSGGGLKGLAHIGVLRALAERGLEPSVVVGCSMGSLIAGAWAAGMPLEEMEDRALAVRRKDIFRVAHVDMALKRMLSPAVYRREPLDLLIHGLVGDRTFRDLPRRLVVNTADLETGQQVLWGLPGLEDAPVADAIYASCSLPGLFPPRVVMGRLCIDGAVVENLPVRAGLAALRAPVIAVDVSGPGTTRRGVERTGFAAIYSRGLEIVMQSLISANLRDWHEVPLLMVQPRVQRLSMFVFHRTPWLIAEGYRATHEALDALPGPLDRIPAAIYPQRDLEISISAPDCVCCGVCISRAPAVFARGPGGKAVVTAPRQRWSPLAEETVRACPTGAITAEERSTAM